MASNTEATQPVAPTPTPPTTPISEAATPAAATPRRRVPRTLIAVGTAIAIYAGLQIWDSYKLAHEKEIILGEARKLSAIPMQDMGEPRRLIFIRYPQGQPKRQFNLFIKPVLDAAAIDYTILDATDAQAASKVARELSLTATRGQTADGVIAVGTNTFRGALQGLIERGQSDPEKIYTLGYVPLREPHGFARFWSFFDDAGSFRKLGEHALAIAEGYRRPMVPDDLAKVEACADFRSDRVRKFQEPAKVVTVDANKIPFQIPFFAFAPERERWREEAEQHLIQKKLLENVDDDKQIKMPTDEDAEQALKEEDASKAKVAGLDFKWPLTTPTIKQ